MTRIKLIGAVGFALAAVTALPAGSAPGASHIVYRCGSGFSNLCRIDPATGVVTQLTRDGKPGGPLYAAPSYSRDGKRMTFTFGNDLYVALDSSLGSEILDEVPMNRADVRAAEYDVPRRRSSSHRLGSATRT